MRIHLPSILVAIASLLPATAFADHYFNTSAGTACHAANGAATSSFNRSLHVLTNIGTTDQYVVCHLQTDDASAAPYPVDLTVWITNGPTPATITCIAQEGGFANGAILVLASNVKSETVVAGANFSMHWNPSDLPRHGPYYEVTFNCKLPPGTKLGMIRWYIAGA